MEIIYESDTHWAQLSWQWTWVYESLMSVCNVMGVKQVSLGLVRYQTATDLKH